MADHDPLCQFSNPIPGVELTCTCPALRLARADQDKKARADERKRIAQEIGRACAHVLREDAGGPREPCSRCARCAAIARGGDDS